MRRHAHLYQVNARILVERLSRKYGRRLTLGTIPEEEWRALARRGFDLLWLMGVWRRSPGARARALALPELRRIYDEVLPGWKPEDVAGSPYAVRGYSLDPPLGKEGQLDRLRVRLSSLGLGLIVDFVPNHLAFDHPWTVAYPERFVRGDAAATRAHPDWFFPTGAGIPLAHGRDPYFPPWTDTVQVNFFSPAMREAWIAELLRIAETADGVRCDMAMLGLNSVFRQVWGEVLGNETPPATEFWTEAISRVKARRPGFLFMAEVYWGLERELEGLGFDFTYDKACYDRLRHGSAADLLSLLGPGAPGPERPIRFIENHDEPRALQAFGLERSLAAAVVCATVPGLRLFHDGQLEGKRIHVPVQLAREPEERPVAEVAEFYDRLLSIADAPAFHEGEWGLLEATPAWSGNPSCRNLLAWCWQHAGKTYIVVVNYSPEQSQGRLALPFVPRDRNEMVFRDALTNEFYVRDAEELRHPGLYVDLGPWKAHVLGGLG